MQKVFAVKVVNCEYDMNDMGLGKYIKEETEKKTEKIIDVFLKKETALKQMREFSKQRDKHNLDRTIFEDAVKYTGEINGKYYKTLYRVIDCTLLEVTED